MYGAKATKDNDFGYGWLPKLDVAYDVLRMFETMHQGGTTGLICQGFNPFMSAPYKAKSVAALSKLKFLVSVDPIETRTPSGSGKITARRTTSTPRRSRPKCSCCRSRLSSRKTGH